MTRTEKEKMLAGELYRADAPELVRDRAVTAAWLARYNAASAADAGELRSILGKRLGEFGSASVIRQPFYCDYGYNIRIGAGVFLNFNCVILDVVSVVIGDGTQIGPPYRSMPPTIRVIRRRVGLGSNWAAQSAWR